MIQAHSEVEKDKLLYALLRRDDLIEGRTNLCPDSEYLQVLGLSLPNGKIVKSHKHLPLHRQTDLTQECWVIVEGSVKATVFDLDDSHFADVILEDGDCIVLFRGGHSLEVLDRDTLMYEIKSGPYHGLEKDKVSINE
jgi:mannose-6-phosphate isomerase-like protein (cupin superfamily)